MDNAFTAIFAAMLAWHQIMFVLSGLFLLLITGLILTHIVHTRLTGTKVNAQHCRCPRHRLTNDGSPARNHHGTPGRTILGAFCRRLA